MAENFSERNREEWRGGGREHWGQQGGYQGGFGQGGYSQGYSQGGLGQGGYGQGGYSPGYREGGIGQGGYYGQQMGPGGYIQGWGQGGYGQGGYTPSSFGTGQEYGYPSEYGRGYVPRGFSYSSISVGRFVGRGPKGYRRSDERIREEVNEELTRHPEIDASEVDVQVRDSEVTLTGKVEDRHQKRLAEDIAERCFGVTDVHNQLKVDKGFFAKLFGTDEEERERERITSGSTERSTTGRTRSTTSR